MCPSSRFGILIHMLRSPLRRLILAAIFFRLAALLAYLYLNGQGDPKWEYEIIALRLLDGRGFTFILFGSEYHSMVVPVFPVLSAALHWVWGPGLGLFYAVNLAISAALIAAVHGLSRSLLGPRPALWAAAFAAFEPSSVLYQSYKVDVAPLAALLMVLAVKHCIDSDRDGSSLGLFLAGGLAGIAVLTRPDALAVFAVPVLWRRLSAYRSVLRGGTIVFAVAMALTVAPWLARNYRLHGRIMITSASGMLLWAGNNPRSTGTLWTAEGTPMFLSVPPELRERLEGAGEAANDRDFRAAAVAYIRSDPAGAAARWGLNFLRFFTYSPDYSGRKYYPWVPAVFVYAYRALFLSLVATALWGTWMSVRAGRRAILVLWGPPLALALIHATHYVEGRHRLLALPFLFILMAAALPDVDKSGESQIARPPE